MLHVWLRAYNSPIAVWHSEERRWHLVDSWQQLFDIYGIHGTTAISLYFPTSHLLQVETSLTASQLKQLGVTGQQYLFDELFLGAVDGLAVRTLSLGDYSSVFAIDSKDIDAWQQSAALAGLSIVALLPDFLLLPIPHNVGSQAVFYQDDATTLLRQSPSQGLSVSYLPLLLPQLPDLAEICIIPPIASALSELAIDPIYDAALISPATKALFDDHGLQLSVWPNDPEPIASPDRHELNFFTKAHQAVLSPYLKTALTVALAAWVLQFAANTIEAYRYQEAAIATQNATAVQYQSWFPNEPLNPKAKLQTQIAPKLYQDPQADNVPLTLLSKVSPLIKSSSITAQALIFEQDAIKMTLIAENSASLDRLVASLSDQGLVANLESVTAMAQGGVSGNLRVSSTAAGAAASPL